MKKNEDIPAIEGGSPASEQYIYFGMPSLDCEEEAVVLEVLRSKWIGMGAKTVLFEKKFSEYVQSKWAFSVNSCTAALHLSLLVSGVGGGDEVLTTPMTFVSTVNAVEYVGANPVFVDIQENTLNIDPGQIISKITPRTKAILPVHFAGLPVAMEQIEKIAEEYNLKIIYDAAHALGAAYDNKKIGSGKHLSCFSFYANKKITTGEGGMITGNDPEPLKDLLIYRQNGLDHTAWERYQSKKVMMNQMTKLGYKYNMTDLNAAIGLVQLSKIEKFLEICQEISGFYNQELQHIDHVFSCYFPHKYPEIRHALHLYVIVLDLKHLSVDRNQIAAALREENIGVAIHYLPIHRHSYYKTKYNLDSKDYPVADRIGLSCLTLPIHPNMTLADAAKVIKGLKKVIKWYKIS